MSGADADPRTGRRRRSLTAVGLSSLAAGLALSEGALSWLLGLEHGLHSRVDRGALVALRLGLVGVGLALVLLRRRRAGARLLAALAIGALLAPLLAEAALRLGIALGVERLRDPQLYASWHGDDDHWKLRYRWQAATRGAPYEGELAHDARLGWSTRTPPLVEDERPLVLLYGDSFLHGVPPLSAQERIAGRLSRELPGAQVVDLAVPGHGLDQILLRVQDTAPAHPRATVVVGLMSLDLDRSILRVRDGPKPWFEELDGELVLRGVPVPEDAAAWHRAHPPRLVSYLGALLQRRYRRLRAGPVATESAYQRARKERLNARLLEELVATTRANGQRLVVVLFHPLWEHELEGWRQRFLHAQLARLDVELLDTRRLFLESAGPDVADLFFPPPNNHPNARANALVAAALASRLAPRRVGQGIPSDYEGDRGADSSSSSKLRR